MAANFPSTCESNHRAAAPHSPVIAGCLRCVQTGWARRSASVGGCGWIVASHSPGDAGAADAEPSGCIATGKQHNKAVRVPLGTLLVLPLSEEQH